MFITRTGASAPDVPSRRGVRARPSAARRDGAGVVGARADSRRRAASRLGFIYLPNGVARNFIGHQLLDADRRRTGLRVVADPDAAGAVPRSAARRQRPGAAPGRRLRRWRQRRSHARHELVADRRASASAPKAPTCATVSRRTRSRRRYSARTRRCRRSSSPSISTSSAASARTATAAPT